MPSPSYFQQPDHSAVHKQQKINMTCNYFHTIIMIKELEWRQQSPMGQPFCFTFAVWTNRVKMCFQLCYLWNVVVSLGRHLSIISALHNDFGKCKRTKGLGAAPFPQHLAFHKKQMINTTNQRRSSSLSPSTGQFRSCLSSVLEGFRYVYVESIIYFWLFWLGLHSTTCFMYGIFRLKKSPFCSF